MKKYDYLVVGSGLFGSVFAYEAKRHNKKVLVIEKRKHIGGNVYTEVVSGIPIHKYGPHIFNTNNQIAWNYINSFSEFNGFINTPLALWKGKKYSLPLNMNTFNQLWGVVNCDEAKSIIREQSEKFGIFEPKNIKEYALKNVGEDIYNILICGYTEKQWGRPCELLPVSIIKRLPIRYTYDNNYYDKKFQGVPIKGYTTIIEKMLDGIEVRLNTDFLSHRTYYSSLANTIIYTGAIDEYYNYCFGKLQYRSLYFCEEVIKKNYFQESAVVNYTDKDIKWTRIIEHKHFYDEKELPQNITIITKEFSTEWAKGFDPYYPINTKDNQELYKKYVELANKEKNIIFGGRLGTYSYIDMDDTIIEAIDLCEKEFNDQEIKRKYQ